MPLFSIPIKKIFQLRGLYKMCHVKKNAAQLSVPLTKQGRSVCPLSQRRGRTSTLRAKVSEM